MTKNLKVYSIVLKIPILVKRPIINKNAGLVTVTATGKQIARLDTYLDDLQKKMQTQVMIDVKMYGVVFDDSKTTGVDWQQLYAFTNGSIGFNTAATSGVALDHH